MFNQQQQTHTTADENIPTQQNNFQNGHPEYTRLDAVLNYKYSLSTNFKLTLNFTKKKEH
jgi:hypothetical protein